MSNPDPLDELPRRQFLKASIGVAAILQFRPETAAAEPAEPEAPKPSASLASPPTVEVSPAGYAFFSAEEATFIEALVDTLCPADGLSPAGTECGLAAYFDRQLGGSFGTGARLYMDGPWQRGKPQQGYQFPFDPAGYFRAGMATAEQACQSLHGKAFGDLSAFDRDAFLQELAAGKANSERFSLSQWFDEMIYPLFTQACFADPIYGGNQDKVFWQMIGYPGLPAFYTEDIKTYRGKPHPAAKSPKSIADFS
jgi:gluconate 2-dehydrogenase gamma chain